MRTKRWKKAELAQLYNSGEKSLRDIAEIYNVSYERIRQVMEEFNIARNRKRKHKYSFFRYKSLEDYLANHQQCGKWDTCQYTIKKYLPSNIFCSECGTTKSLIVHHIQYPARRIEDIQILCRSCHRIKHINGMTLAKQIELYDAYNSGVKRRKLTQRYNVSYSTVDKILHKIKNN